MAHKTYKLICHEFGWKFSFHSKNDLEATSKKNKWCSYHGFNFKDYSLEVTIRQEKLHNEYVEDL